MLVALVLPARLDIGVAIVVLAMLAIMLMQPLGVLRLVLRLFFVLIVPVILIR
jgi:hypothetical protein